MTYSNVNRVYVKLEDLKRVNKEKPVGTKTVVTSIKFEGRKRINKKKAENTKITVMCLIILSKRSLTSDFVYY